MAQFIAGNVVTSTLRERQRAAERHLGRFGVSADLCPHSGRPRFTQSVRQGYDVGGVGLLARIDEQISMWRDGVTVWDVLRNRRDYRRTKEVIEAKLERATQQQRDSQALLEEIKREKADILQWYANDRNEGRYQVLNLWGRER